MEAYEVALACKPRGVHYHLTNLSNAGQSAIGFGDFGLADSIAIALIKAFPDKLNGYDIQSRQLSVAGKYAEAIVVYDTILARFDDGGMFNGSDYYYQRGVAYHALGNDASACADWEEALARGQEEAKVKLDSLCAGK
jgi:tetratricopeptide (TPR) repeat protein